MPSKLVCMLSKWVFRWVDAEFVLNKTCANLNLNTQKIMFIFGPKWKAPFHFLTFHFILAFLHCFHCFGHLSFHLLGIWPFPFDFVFLVAKESRITFVKVTHTMRLYLVEPLIVSDVIHCTIYLIIFSFCGKIAIKSLGLDCTCFCCRFVFMFSSKCC